MSNKAVAKTILASIKNSPIVKAGKPAAERHLVRAEKDLGVRFPGLYRELLRLAGQIDIWEGSMFGLGPSAERWDAYAGITVTELTQMARDEANVRLPEHLIAIWHDCHQDYQCLDTSRISRGDCPIVLFDTEIAASPRRRPKRVARGLGEWLALRIKVATEQKAMIDEDEPVRKKQKKSKSKGGSTKRRK